MFATTIVAQAATLQTSQQNSNKTYGNAQGFGIDFDSTAVNRATATPVLTNGVTYSLDDISVRVNTSHGKFGATRDSYLGIYTSVATNGVLSGFLGVSTNSVHLVDGSNKNFQTWTFSNIDVTVDNTVGSESGLLFFVFQTNTTAVTSLNETFDTPLIRDNRFTTTQANTLGSIINGATPNKVVISRAPLYKATLTIAGGGPEPGPVPPPPVITSIDFSGGIVSVTATNLTIDTQKYILIWTDDLTGTFTNEVEGSEISNLTTQVGVLQDTNPPPANTFYTVKAID